MPPPDRRVLLSAPDIDRVLQRLATEIIDFAGDINRLVLVGIERRGAELAERLAARVRELTGVDVPRGALDITLYRDDLETVGPRPIVGETRIPVSIDSRIVVVVDDVLYTGRTVRAALDELADFGRPDRIGLCVLVDRGGRELPIQADLVGERVVAAPDERVDVLLVERDGRDVVELVAGGAVRP